MSILYAAAVLAQSPVRYYRLGDPASTANFYDCTGSGNNGSTGGGMTLAQTGYASGIDPNLAVTFDGTSGGISLPTAGLQSGNGAWTLMAWANPTANTGPSRDSHIVSMGNPGTTAAAAILAQSSAGGWKAVTQSGDTAVYGQSLASTWSFVAGTWDGTTLTIYVNGVAGTTATPGARSLSQTSVYIGKSKAAGVSQNWFGGTVDEVAFFNSALSATTIASLYATGIATNPTYQASIVSDNPHRYYRLGETSGTIAQDLGSDYLHGTYTGGFTLAQNGALANDTDQAVKLNGSTGYITAGTTNLATGNGAWGMEAWVRSNITISGYTCATSFGTYSANLGAELGVDNTGHAYAGFTGGSQVGGGAIAAGIWYHLAATYDGVSTLKLYINGALANTVTASAGNITASACSVGNYYNGAGGGYWNGSIDEAAFFTSPQSAAHILARYNAGLGLYYATVKADSPLRFYRLNEVAGTVAYDLGSGAQNGTYNGGYTQSVTGPLANDTNFGVTFNGSTGYISCPTTSLPSGNTHWSLEMWVKFPSLPGGTQFPGGWGTSATKQEVGFTVSTTGTYVLTTSSNDTPASPAQAANTWHYLAGTWDGTTMSLYVDGLLSTTLASATLSVTLTKMTIGANVAGTIAQFFNGTIADVAVYSTNLTASQIAHHYAAGASTYAQAVLTDGPVAYWRLGETSGTAFNDSSGSGNTMTLTGSLTSGASALWGDTNNSFNFTGANSLQTAGTLANMPNFAISNFSLEAWVRLTSYQTFTSSSFGDYLTSSAWLTIMGLGYSTAFSNPNTAIVINQFGQPTFFNGFGGFNFNAVYTPTQGISPLSLDVWHHIVWTATPTLWLIYIDGVLSYTVTALPFLASYSTTSTIAFIGGSNNGNLSYLTFTNGQIDEVAIYNTVLSATRISAHYQAALVPTSTTYSATVLADSPVRYYRLNEAVGVTTLVDTSTSASNATTTNTPGMTMPGALINDTNFAMSVNGTTQYATLSATTGLQTGNGAWTLECWAMPRAAVTGSGLDGHMISMGTAGTNGEAAVIAQNAAGGWKTTTWSGDINTTSSPVGQWAHVVGTYDGTTLKLYVNGVFAVSSTPGARTLTQAHANIGVSNVAGTFQYYFAGNIDEVAIYSTALSATRILTHYQVGIFNGIFPTYPYTVVSDVPTIYYRLGESSGNFTDSAGGQNTGVANGSPTYSASGAISGDSNTAVTFNGTNAYITCTPGLPTSLTGTFTIEAFVKFTGTTAAKIMGTRTPSDNGFDVDIAKGTGSSSSALYTLHVDFGNGSVINSFAISTAFNNVSSGYLHLVVVYSANYVDFWVNGVLIQNYRQFSPNNTPLAWDGTHHLTVGWNSIVADTKFAGTLDEVAIYSGYLNPGRILAHFLLSGQGQPTSTGAGSFAVPGVGMPGQIATGADLALTVLPQIAAPSQTGALTLTYTTGSVASGALTLTYHVLGPKTMALPLTYTIAPTKQACSINGVTGFPAPEQITYSYPQLQYDVSGRPVEQGYAQMVWHWDTLTQTEMAALMSGYNPNSPSVLVTFIDENLTWLTLQAFMIPPNLGTRDTLYHSNIDVTFTHIQPR